MWKPFNTIYLLSEVSIIKNKYTGVTTINGDKGCQVIDYPGEGIFILFKPDRIDFYFIHQLGILKTSETKLLSLHELYFLVHRKVRNVSSGYTVKLQVTGVGCRFKEYSLSSNLIPTIRSITLKGAFGDNLKIYLPKGIFSFRSSITTMTFFCVDRGLLTEFCDQICNLYCVSRNNKRLSFNLQHLSLSSY